MSDGSTIGSAGKGITGFFGAFEQMDAEYKQVFAMEENARFYEKQGTYAKDASEREQMIFKNEVDDLLGRQTSAYGKAGVDLSGSPMMLIGQTKERAGRELKAIQEKGRQNVELAMMRARSTQKSADELRDGIFGRFGMNLFSNVINTGTGSSDNKKAAPKDVESPAFKNTGSGTAVKGGSSYGGGGNIPYDSPTYTGWEEAN